MKKTVWVARNKRGEWFKFDECPGFLNGIWSLPPGTKIEDATYYGIRIEWYNDLEYHLPWIKSFTIPPTICLFQVEIEEENGKPVAKEPAHCTHVKQFAVDVNGKTRFFKTCESCGGIFDADVEFRFFMTKSICEKCWRERVKLLLEEGWVKFGPTFLTKGDRYTEIREIDVLKEWD